MQYEGNISTAGDNCPHSLPLSASPARILSLPEWGIKEAFAILRCALLLLPPLLSLPLITLHLHSLVHSAHNFISTPCLLSAVFLTLSSCYKLLPSIRTQWYSLAFLLSLQQAWPLALLCLLAPRPVSCLMSSPMVISVVVVGVLSPLNIHLA